MENGRNFEGPESSDIMMSPIQYKRKIREQEVREKEELEKEEKLKLLMAKRNEAKLKKMKLFQQLGADNIDISKIDTYGEIDILKV
jgi:hypothetical protein